MRGISKKTLLKAELVAAGRIAYLYSPLVFCYSKQFPYNKYSSEKTPQIWRLSDDIVDSYEDWNKD